MTIFESAVLACCDCLYNALTCYHSCYRISSRAGSLLVKMLFWNVPGEVTIKYCLTKEIVADFFTKPLAGVLFKRFRNFIQGIDQDDMPKYKRAFDTSTADQLAQEVAITNKVNPPYGK